MRRTQFILVALLLTFVPVLLAEEEIPDPTSDIVFTINSSPGPLTVSPGATLSWNASATCVGPQPEHCTVAGSSQNGPVVDGYSVSVERDGTEVAFGPTSGGAVGGTLTAPSTPGTYSYRAHHAQQFIWHNGARHNWAAAHSSFINVTVTDTFDFSITNLAPASQTVLRGGQATYTFTVTLISGTAQAVTLSAVNLPSGASAAFTSNPVTPTTGGVSVTMTVTTGPTTLGDFTNVQVSGTAGSTTRNSNSVALRIYDFTVGVSPTPQSVLRGCSKDYSVSVNLVAGSTTTNVPSNSLTINSLPSGVTGVFAPAFGTPSFTSPLTLSTTVAAAVGSVNFTVTGTDSNGSRTSTSATLNIWDFTVDLSPPDWTVLRGGSTTYTVSVVLESGSLGAPADVPLSLSGKPADATVTGFPASLAFATGSATFTVQTVNTGSGSVGDFTLTATSSVDCSSRSDSSGLHIYDFTISVSPSSKTLLRGCSTDYTVTVSLLGSSVGVPAVTLSTTSSLPSGVTGVFTPPSGTPSFTSTLTLSTTAAAPLGTVSFKVTGTDSNGSRTSNSAELNLYDYTITLSPNPLVLAQNQQGAYTVTLTLTPGSASPPPITLSHTILPPTITGALNDSVLTPTVGGTTTFLLIPPTPPATPLPAGSFSVTVTGTDGQSPCTFRSASAGLNVVTLLISGSMRDTSCNDLPNGFDAVFVKSGPTLNATNPGGFIYNVSVQNVGTAATITSLTLSLPPNPDDGKVVPNTPGASAFLVWGSRPVHVFAGDPCTPGAVDFTPDAVAIYDASNVLQAQPLRTNSTAVRPDGSITIPAISVPAGATLWVQVHIRYALLGTASWAGLTPGDPSTTFIRGYQFKAEIQPLSNPLSTAFTGTGKKLTGIGGTATDVNGDPKSGLGVVIGSANCATATPSIFTEPLTGFYFAALPANTSSTVRLCNATAQAAPPQSFGPVAQDQFLQVNFTNINPADPVIEGIVGTATKGVGGVKVELINVARKVVATTSTNAGGYYVFRFSAPGSYTVRITPPPGYRAQQDSDRLIPMIGMFETVKADFLLTLAQ